MGILWHERVPDMNGWRPGNAASWRAVSGVIVDEFRKPDLVDGQSRVHEDPSNCL